MHRALILLLLAAPFAWSQEAEDSDAASSDTAEPAEQQVAEDADDALEDIDDLDELYPVEDDDAFIPSEDVAFGQSIPFPTDI